MPESRRAKVFWSGRSQAVRLPKEFRFEGSEVVIRKVGDAVVLEPIARPAWPDGFWDQMDALPPLPADFSTPARPRPSREPDYRDRVVAEWPDDGES